MHKARRCLNTCLGDGGKKLDMDRKETTQKRRGCTAALEDYVKATKYGGISLLTIQNWKYIIIVG